MTAGIIEIFAAAFLLLGAGAVLIAAIGVVRLPDTFLRMHAATKAGVVGAGLFTIGVGFALSEPGVWLRVAAILVFLLITTPVAAHVLGRAAYVAGAPLWAGTMADQLSGTIARDVSDIDPSRTVRRPRTSPEPHSQDAAMSVLAFQPEPASHQAQSALRGLGLRRLLVGLSAGPEAGPTVRHAINIARRHQAVVTGLSIIDLPSVERAEPRPIGGTHWARLATDARLRVCRERAALLLTDFEEASRAAGVAYAARHVEGNAVAALKTAGAHDVVLVPARQWFDHGVGLSSGDSIRRLLVRVRPLILCAGEPRPIRDIVVLHDGSDRAAATLRWLLQLGLWSDAVVHLVGFGEASATLETALADALVYTQTHARTAHIAGYAEAAADLDPNRILGVRPDAVIVGNAGRSGQISRLFPSNVAKHFQNSKYPVVLG